MNIATPLYEAMSDFVTETLLCQTCQHETNVVGPLPESPCCAACGSSCVIHIKLSKAQEIWPTRRAA